jgi:hypothetical protein
MKPINPSLYQINTRVWTTSLSKKLGRRAHLYDKPLLVVVNHASYPGQCYVSMPFPEIKGRSVQINDKLTTASYSREGNDLLSRGLYLDMTPWAYHVFELEIEQRIRN